MELNQVDTLNVFNDDSPAADVGQLTSTRLTGLGMGGDTVIAGRKLNGGISYGSAGVRDRRATRTASRRSTSTSATAPTASGSPARTAARPPSGPAGRRHDRRADASPATPRCSARTATTSSASAPNVPAGPSTIDADRRAAGVRRRRRLRPPGRRRPRRRRRERRHAHADDDHRPRPARARRHRPALRAAAAGRRPERHDHARGRRLGRAAGRRPSRPPRIESALQNLLFPNATSCGTGGATRCAQSVFAWKVGGDFLIGFRGERQGHDLRAADRLRPRRRPGALRAARPGHHLLRPRGARPRSRHRQRRPQRAGHGRDVAHQRDARPRRRARLRVVAGRTSVSPRAPDFLPGTLDLIAGTLNVDFGSGRHQLMISDEAAIAGDDALITRDRTAAKAKDGRLTSEAELAADAQIYVVGLSPRAITYRTDGNLADGITIWTGHGNDKIVINATHRNGTLQEITSLNTGLGDDDVLVALSSAVDGFFVLDTQGAYQQLLPGVTLYEGDDIRPADQVLAASIGGAALAAGQFFGNAMLDAVGLTVSPRFAAGDWLATQITLRRTFTEVLVTAAGPAGPRTIDIAALEPADLVSISVDGVDNGVHALWRPAHVQRPRRGTRRRLLPARLHPGLHRAERRRVRQRRGLRRRLDAAARRVRRPGRRRAPGRRGRRPDLRRPRPRALPRERRALRAPGRRRQPVAAGHARGDRRHRPRPRRPGRQDVARRRAAGRARHDRRHARRRHATWPGAGRATTC